MTSYLYSFYTHFYQQRFINIGLLSLIIILSSCNFTSVITTGLADKPSENGVQTTLVSENRPVSYSQALSNAPRFALIIGNSSYKYVPKLRNPVNDATDIASVLKELGFKVTLKRNVDKETMVNAIRSFGAQLRQGGTGLFYFAGHGFQYQGRNFLVPVDAKIKTAADIEFESVDANRVLAQMQQANNGVNIVILDACRDNPFAVSSRTITRGLARMDSPTGTLIAYATSPGDVAADGKGRNGTFTKHLLVGLRTKSHLSITDMFTEITGSVFAETGGEQVPWQSASLTQRVCLTQCAEVGTTVVQQSPLVNKPTLAPKSEPVATSKPKPKPKLKSRSSKKFKVFRNSLRSGGKGPKMVWIPSGSFRMGDIQGNGKYGQVHQVAIKRFAMGQYEITFAEYDRFAEATKREKPADNGWGRGNQPVINVSMEDAMDYTKWLSKQTGKKYRLPTEAEWEYAARAGTETYYWWGNEIGSNQANCAVCGSSWDRKQTAPVGSFEFNAFGLYDLAGNVFEWTCSEFEKRYSGKEQKCVNKKRVKAVYRGGSWRSKPLLLRSAYRNVWGSHGRNSLIGFRVVREQ